MTETYPKGTTKEQWDRYYEESEKFEKHMSSTRPKLQNFKTLDDFERAYNEWAMARSCDAPNKPGYYRANND